MLRTERVYIAVTSVALASEKYSRVLGVPAPKMERGTVINADMAIFQFGPTGLGLAQLNGPGVCADAIARRGPGPQHWRAGMLVAPEHACGVYIGFVGPA